MAYTLNLGIVVNNGDGVTMIRCESERSISRAKVASIAKSHLDSAVKKGLSAAEIVDAVICGVMSACNVEAYVVQADVTYVVNPVKGGRKREW